MRSLERPESAPKPKRDWFGYLFTAVAGIVATVIVAWYQLYIAQRDAAAAELEKARAVKQVAVAIVEEHALNGKKLEIDRLARLIEERRRTEGVGLPVSVTDVVEQAEFSIASSRHLSMDRKEEMKPLFDAFYSELRARSFEPLGGTSPTTALIDEVAKRIQEGKPTEALTVLKRLQEVHDSELSKAFKASKPGLVDVVNELLSSPTRLALYLVALVGYLWLITRLKWYLKRRHSRRELGLPL